MANEKEEKTLTLITTEGKEIKVEYTMERDKDDCILEEVREAIENNKILCLSEYNDCYITFGSFYIDELDCKKIIGFSYFL